MPYSEPIPVEDAIAIERHDDGSRTYSDVLLAADSKITGATWGELTEVVDGLYAGGYALVKVLPEEAVPTRWAPVQRAMDGDWVDDMRQLVEQRLGVPAGDESVLDDPAYVAVLDADRALEEARDQVAAALEVVTQAHAEWLRTKAAEAPRPLALNPDDRVSHDVHGTGVVLSVGTDSCFVRFGSEPISHGDAVFHTPAERRVPTEELTLDDKAADQ